MTLPLTSSRNPQLQTIRKAVVSGRPTPDGLIVAEGPHLLEEVQRSPWQVEEILTTPEAAAKFAGLLHTSTARVTEVSGRAFDSVSATENTQGILALLRPKLWTWNDLTDVQPLVVVLDAVQDPGNVGTIIRSAEAFGATGIVLAPGCARLSNPKVLRAAAGSAFRLPVLEDISRNEQLDNLRTDRIGVYSLGARGSLRLQDADLRGPSGLIVGNEGSGLSSEFAAAAEELRIPTAAVESLNAAVACSIALFEASRQRAMA